MTGSPAPGKRFTCWLATATLLLAGCASSGGRPTPTARSPAADPVATCRSLFHQVDSAVKAAGVGDAQAARVPGLPYLRIDRFHAAVSPGPGPGFAAWVDRLRDLDRQARRAELANLNPAPPASRAADLETCATVLRAHDLSDPQMRAGLAGLRAGDAYQPWLRVLGLYPITALPFLLGVRRLHRETAAAFATPLAELPLAGTLRRYGPDADAPLSADAVAAMLSRAADNPLGIPEPTEAELQTLFRQFAPRWEIDVAGPADRPGRPRLDADGRPRVDGPATVYTMVSFTRWQGQPRLQLNYQLWFPARPRQGPFDLVGGALDGITWRVTLGADGRPLLYDAMHNCGCYYKAFPTPRLASRSRRRGFEEPLAIPQTVPDGGGRPVLRVSADSHYLQRIYRDTEGDGEPYALADYQQLRSLALPGGGRRSLFGADGLVPGTERRERWLFWPMGVPEPGAMRQWGHHAIAFVGRRHFDDPDLLARYFEPAGEAGGSAGSASR